MRLSWRVVCSPIRLGPSGQAMPPALLVHGRLGRRLVLQVNVDLLEQDLREIRDIVELVTLRQRNLRHYEKEAAGPHGVTINYEPLIDEEKGYLLRPRAAPPRVPSLPSHRDPAIPIMKTRGWAAPILVVVGGTALSLAFACGPHFDNLNAGFSERQEAIVLAVINFDQARTALPDPVALVRLQVIHRLAVVDRLATKSITQRGDSKQGNPPEERGRDAHSARSKAVDDTPSSAVVLRPLSANTPRASAGTM